MDLASEDPGSHSGGCRSTADPAIAAMKRRLVPRSSRDRFTVVASTVGAGASIVGLVRDELLSIVVFLVLVLLALVSAYVFQDGSAQFQSDEYPASIAQARAAEKALADLGAFLERQRASVLDTENTLNILRAEKEKLEPIVSTYRETVDAILAAHSAWTSARVWKERINFLLFLLLVIIAGAVLLGIGMLFRVFMFYAK